MSKKSEPTPLTQPTTEKEKRFSVTSNVKRPVYQKLRLLAVHQDTCVSTILENIITKAMEETPTPNF